MEYQEEEINQKSLSSCKIDKYEYLTGGQILPAGQKSMIKQVKPTYSPLGNAF